MVYSLKFITVVTLGISVAARPVPRPNSLTDALAVEGSKIFDKFTKAIDPLRKQIDKVVKPVGDAISGVIDKLDGDTKNTNNETTEALVAMNVDYIVPHALFANAAYCTGQVVIDWKCGETCDKLPGVEVFLTGGDNEAVPWFFIAHDPNSQSIVVSTQGTEPTNLGSIAVDLTIPQVPLNKTLFPNAPEDVRVHEGFQKSFEANAVLIQQEVEKQLKAKNVNQVLITGHSLGGAISVMNAVHLRTVLPEDVDIQTTVFGLPRGGNSAWANFVDSTLGVGPQFVHMHIGKDIVPTIPPRTFFDYHHPSGEVYDPLDGSGPKECPGQENNNCSAGNNVLQKSIIDHLGPYAGVSMGTIACPL